MAMALTKSGIASDKIAYSAIQGVDRRPPALVGPKQSNIQLSLFDCKHVFNQKA